MICIAAFVILLIIVLCLPIIRIFNKKSADKIWKLFKKSTYCVGRRVTLRKCDSSFKDDIKNSILRKVVLKHPKWVKPISAAIEVAAVLIILVTIWSLLTVVKSGVSLYVYGTCNPSQPSACVLNSTEACSINSTPVNFWQNPIKWTGNWFSEFGQAFAAIPTRMKHWDARDYLPDPPNYFNKYDPNKPIALDVFDPGCIICKKSFQNQLSSGFLDRNNMAVLPYPIKSGDGYKFPNSFVVVSYLEAVRLKPLKTAPRPVEWQIIKRMFTENAPNGDNWQNAFNVAYTNDQARKVLNSWLKDFGYDANQIAGIAELAKSDQIQQIIERNRNTVDNQIKTRKIPTMIFNGQRHDGLFEEQ